MSHQVSEGGQVWFGHSLKQRRNLVRFSDAEVDRTNKSSVQGVSAKGFRKLSKEKLQEMLLEREDNDVLINKL